MPQAEILFTPLYRFCGQKPKLANSALKMTTVSFIHKFFLELRKYTHIFKARLPA